MKNETPEQKLARLIAHAAIMKSMHTVDSTGPKLARKWTHRGNKI